MAVLSKAGCNQGTCHGNAHGKGGLKLSLRGQDPDSDFLTLTRQSASRRIALLNPDASLLLQKPSMTVPHEGGRRFQPESDEYQILKRWIAAGTPNDSDSIPTLVSLKVTPANKTVYAPQTSVQLQAEAQFSDGTTADVTRLAVFDSSATFVSVSSAGNAVAEKPGLTTITVRYLNQQIPVRLEFVPQKTDFEFRAPTPDNLVDRAVFDQLKRLRLNPAQTCDDTVFLRRVYLDLTGLLPTVDEAKEFLSSKDPNRRAALIDRLLASEEFNDFQALRWADLLRVEDKTLDSRGVEVFHNWIRTSFAEQKPLNQFAAELLAARGSTYKVPPANFYRALRKPEERSEAAAQMFLGIRLQCAKCHNHPFDRWTQDDYYGWTNFFARIDYEILENKRRDKNDKHEFAGEQIVKLKDSGDITNPGTGRIAGLRFLGSEADIIVDNAAAGDPAPDRLQQLADWISSPENSRFAATQANRIWAQLMGRGIIDPIDDFRSTNPPSNPKLLQELQREFVANEFRVRHLMKTILLSRTYQSASLSAGHSDTGDEWAGCFARTEIRRLTAEQLLDGICRVLDVPVLFGGHKLGTKAVQLRGVRNGGHRFSVPESGDRFLKLFGKPNRLQSCECERTTETTLAQTFEMVSGQVISELIAKPGNRIDRAVKAGTSDTDIVTELYWAALSRPPKPKELESATAHLEKQKSRQQGLEDIAWALLNSNEFLLRR